MSYLNAFGVNNNVPLVNEANDSHFAGALGADKRICLGSNPTEAMLMNLFFESLQIVSAKVYISIHHIQTASFVKSELV